LIFEKTGVNKAMELNLNNTEIAFKIKSNKDLKRALFLFNAISQPFMVKLGNVFTRIALRLKAVKWH
jgi:proline dehydrogenase